MRHLLYPFAAKIMTHFDKFKTQIERADRFIRNEATGTSTEFANLLGTSKSTVFRMLQFIREHNFPVKYCRFRRTFYYEYSGKLEVSFKYVQTLPGQEEKF